MKISEHIFHYMNVVILSTWSFEGVFGNFYICEYISANNCRRPLIQRALKKAMSQLSNAHFPINLGQFLTSPDSFEVGTPVKTRRNFDLNLSFIHVTF